MQGMSELPQLIYSLKLVNNTMQYNIQNLGTEISMVFALDGNTQ
jgi:hypothetical protein